MDMKSRTYNGLGNLLECLEPHLGKIGEIVVSRGIEYGARFLESGRQREQLREDIKTEYHKITGKEPEEGLENYISASVDRGWKLYKNYGEKRACLYAINRLEKVKEKFSPDAKVAGYIDDKIEELRGKI